MSEWQPVKWTDLHILRTDSDLPVAYLLEIHSAAKIAHTPQVAFEPSGLDYLPYQDLTGTFYLVLSDLQNPLLINKDRQGVVEVPSPGHLILHDKSAGSSLGILQWRTLGPTRERPNFSELHLGRQVANELGGSVVNFKPIRDETLTGVYTETPDIHTRVRTWEVQLVLKGQRKTLSLNTRLSRTDRTRLIRGWFRYREQHVDTLYEARLTEPLVRNHQASPVFGIDRMFATATPERRDFWRLVRGQIHPLIERYGHAQFSPDNVHIAVNSRVPLVLFFLGRDIPLPFVLFGEPSTLQIQPLESIPEHVVSLDHLAGLPGGSVGVSTLNFHTRPPFRITWAERAGGVRRPIWTDSDLHHPAEADIARWKSWVSGLQASDFQSMLAHLESLDFSSVNSPAEEIPLETRLNSLAGIAFQVSIEVSQTLKPLISALSGQQFEEAVSVLMRLTSSHASRQRDGERHHAMVRATDILRELESQMEQQERLRETLHRVRVRIQAESEHLLAAGPRSDASNGAWMTVQSLASVHRELQLTIQVLVRHELSLIRVLIPALLRMQSDLRSSILLAMDRGRF